jgi:arsenite methyltransferase
MVKSCHIAPERVALRRAIPLEYEAVAREPQRGFHFPTGYPLARRLGYSDEWLAELPEGSIESFAGTGNPFSIDPLKTGERAIDIGCGAGIDNFISARMVGSSGFVVGVDMTPAMLDKPKDSASALELTNIEFREGFGEELPIPDNWADVIISDGVLNLIPDKQKDLAEMARVLNRDGRLQIVDILVEKAVPQEAKGKIELWTG